MASAGRPIMAGWFSLCKEEWFMKALGYLSVISILLFSIGFTAVSTDDAGTAYITLIGHASLKIKTSGGVVIYIDPYHPGDYSEKADIVLISHEHSDHNKLSLITQNEGCRILTVKDTNNKNGTYNSFNIKGVLIEPVPAANRNHTIETTNGFVISFDGLKVYHASDTSKLPQMADLKAKEIDYAFFPIDGQYNMGPAEAAECAAIVGAKHNIPFHYFNADVTKFKPANLLSLPYGGTIAIAR